MDLAFHARLDNRRAVGTGITWSWFLVGTVELLNVAVELISNGAFSTPVGDAIVDLAFHARLDNRCAVGTGITWSWFLVETVELLNVAVDLISNRAFSTPLVMRPWTWYFMPGWIIDVPLALALRDVAHNWNRLNCLNAERFVLS